MMALLTPGSKMSNGSSVAIICTTSIILVVIGGLFGLVALGRDPATVAYLILPFLANVLGIGYNTIQGKQLSEKMDQVIEKNKG